MDYEDVKQIQEEARTKVGIVFAGREREKSYDTHDAQGASKKAKHVCWVWQKKHARQKKPSTALSKETDRKW